MGIGCSLVTKLKVLSFTVCNTKRRSSSQAGDLRAVTEKAQMKETFKMVLIRPVTRSSANLRRLSPSLVGEAKQGCAGLARRWRAPRCSGKVFI